MKNIFHRLSIIRIVIAAFLAVVVPYYAHAAATIKLDTELQIRSESDELALAATSLNYNSTTGFYDTDNSKYVTIYNKDLDGYSLFWCWDDKASGASDYFDYNKCSPYSVGIIIPSGQEVNTITLRFYRQATDFNWIRISYATNEGTHGTEYNNYYTWPRFCTNQATCTMPDPDGVFVRSGYKFDGWDASALHSTLTGAGAIAAGGTLGSQYITVKKDVTIKATWELAAIKANVTINMNGSVSNPPKLLGDCTSVSCYTPYDAPTRYGYDFTGWKVSAGGAPASEKTYGKYTDIKDFVTYDNIQLVLIAQWEPYPYYIKYACSAEDATNGKYVYEDPSEFGANFTVISKETSDGYCNKQNYDIARWKYNDNDNDIDGEPVFNFGETYKIDILATAYTYELVPEYKPKTYYITYECDDGTMLSGYNNTQEVTFSQSYTTAGKICTKDGYYQTGWQTPNAANGGYFEYKLNTEQDSYGFWGNRTFTATYELSKVVYDCGKDATLIRSECDNIDNDDKCIQNFGSNTTFSPKVKICSKEGAYQVGWKNLNDSDDTYDFYSDYDSDIAAGKTLVPIWLNSKVDIDCDIEFTSTPTALSMPNNISAMTGHSLPDVTTIPVVSGKAFDGWAYHDENNSMWFKYFDQNGSPIRVLDGEHCERGSMTLQAQWIDTGCNEKDVYNGMLATPFDSTPIATLYCDDSGACYNNNKCSGTQVDITENTFTKPSNAIYQGIWRHYTPGGASDIRCIDENGVFNYDNLDTCLSMSSDWYVKYTCKNNYVNINGQCVHTTNVYFDGNYGTGGATNSTITFYYEQELPTIASNSLPERTNYKFMGWYDNPNYTTASRYYNEKERPVAQTWDKLNDSATLYAGWKPISDLTVTYDCGTGAYYYKDEYKNAQPVDYGKEYRTLGEICYYSGQVLTGWKAYTAEGIVSLELDTTIDSWPYTTNTTLYAVWDTPDSHNCLINIQNNDGIGGQDTWAQNTSNALTENVDTPTKADFNFTGYWYKHEYSNTYVKYYDYDGTRIRDYIEPSHCQDGKMSLYALYEEACTPIYIYNGLDEGNFDTTNIIDTIYRNLSGFYSDKDCTAANKLETYNVHVWPKGTEETKFCEIHTTEGYQSQCVDPYTGKIHNDVDECKSGSWVAKYMCDIGKSARDGICIASSRIELNKNDGDIGPDGYVINLNFGDVLPDLNIKAEYKPKRAGYEFMGWYDGTNYATSTQYYDASGKPTVPTWDKTDANVTLYAGWKEKTTDIIYTFNGLTNTINYSAVPGTPYVFPTFEILGFTNNNPYQTLTGWRLTWGNDYFEGEVGTQIPSDLLENVYDTTEDAKITATPLFDEIIGIELKFWYDENTPISNSNSCTDKSCVLQKFLDDHKTGHMFNGWAVRGEGKLSDVFPELTDLAEYINADTPKQIDVYADWMPESYKLTYSCGDEATGDSQTFNITFGESHTIPDVTVCKMNGKKPLGWIINGTSYNFPTQIIWDIDVGDPDTTFVITPKWDDFYSTTLVIYTMLGQSGTILPDTCNNYTCVLPQNMYTYEGHTFSGWQVNNQTFNAGHDIKNLINANTPSQLHIVAQWQPNEYTLTYSCGDDATGTPPAAQNIQYNSEFTFTTNAGTCTKDGWNFIGWEIDNHQEQTFTWAYTENKTAVARWTENTSFVVTLNPNGGTGGQTSVNVEYGNQLSRLDSIPTRPYYIFTGFYDSADKQYFDEYGDGNNVTWDKKQNYTLYAHWQPQEFDVTYNCGEGSNPPSPQSARYEEEFTPAENTCTRTGYTFAGWTVDGESVPNSFKWTFTEPVTFTAQWTANGNYTVTLDPDNGDTRYYILNNVVYNQLMSNITNTPKRTGYTFDGYYYGNTQYFDKDGHCVKAYDIDRNVTMFAHWTPKEYAVRYQCGNDATSSTLPQPFVKYDQEYELLSGICNKEGYIFIGWKADNAGDILYAGIPFTWTYDKNTTFVAQYTQNVYKVYLQYDGNGADNDYTSSLQTCTSDAECLLLPADTFTRRGYRFTGWIVGLTSTGVQFNPQDDIKQYITSAWDGKTISVRARWTAVPYNVTYDANGGVSTLPKTECTIESCTPVSVGNIGTYMTRPGYIFKHWTTDLKIGNPANLSNGISQDTTLYAMWDACPIGYYKPDDVAADAQCLSCEKLSDPSTRTEYNATSNLASTSREDCAATCTPFNLQGGRATPVKDTVQYPEKCEYTAISDKGNPCTIVDNKCVEKSCGMGYELVNNECTLCPDDNAATYYQSNSCDIKACKPGYHVNPSDIRQCAEDVIECYDIPNATYATKTWNTQAYSYGKCTAVECDTDYHIEDSVCAPDTRECDIENGTGWQEWLYKSKTWSECYAEQCNPGYESDGNGCVRCDNAYDEYGDLAASTYIQGCEIATCMYQGEKYILANNQCVLVCYNDQDNTGAMWWDSNTKKCRRECSPGYSHWDQ